MNVVLGLQGDVTQAGAIIDGLMIPVDPAHRYLRPALAWLVLTGGGAMLIPDAPDAVLLT